MFFSSITSFYLDRWSDKRWVLFLVCVTLFTLLPGFFSIPPVDRDETRFAQATRQMVASGDYIDIQFQDSKRYKKPIGIYWLQSLSVHTIGPIIGEKLNAPIWVYRLPSLFGIMAGILAVFWVARVFMQPYGAGIASLLMALAILPGFEAKIAKTDAFLFFLVLVSQRIIAHVWKNREHQLSKMYHLVFWSALALGVLLKGPIILLVCGLSVVTLLIIDRSFGLIKRLRYWSGLLIFLMIVLPWFIAIGFKSHGAFFVEAGLVDFLGKVANVKESHGGPPGIYTVLMIATFWPASLFFWAAIPEILKNRHVPVIVFAAAWALPSWIVFELTPTKLPHYVLPLYPALALATAYIFQNGMRFDAWWQKLLMALLFVVPLLLSSAVFGGLIYFERLISPFVALFGSMATIAGFFAWKRFTKPEKVPHALALVIVSVVSIYLAVYQFAFPKLETIWISNRLVETLDKHKSFSGCPNPSLVAVGYHEPSLAFLGPLDLRFETATSAAEKLSRGQCGYLFITSEKEPVLRPLTVQYGLVLAPLDTVYGLKLNGGDKVAITLYEVMVRGVADND